jgi:von Willebrand factor type A domain.
MSAWVDLTSGLAVQWAQPLALSLLPLSVLPLLAARRAHLSEAAPAPQLLHPDLHGLLQASPPHRKPRIAPVLRALALLAFVLALAQPQREGAWIVAAPEGRDIVVLLDTSLTMSLHDLTWAGKPASRLAVAQRVFADFARARQGDRFALVAFGSHAATLLPPTFDARAAGQMAGLLAVGQLGPDTALGRRHRLGCGRCDRLSLKPILILYTDGGQSNTGSISPADAVALARHMGVRIYTVEVGATPDPGAPTPCPPTLGRSPICASSPKPPGAVLLRRQRRGATGGGARHRCAQSPAASPAHASRRAGAVPLAFACRSGVVVAGDVG